MSTENVIEPAMSRWASPVGLAPKNDGKLPVYVDYRKLSAMTIQNTYPFPRMDECIEFLGNAAIFCATDCDNGYWQIDISETDRDKATFSSHHWLARSTWMPFGLKIAPALFQRAVVSTLPGVQWQLALVYPDDIIVYLKSVSEHSVHVRTVLTIL